MQLHNYVVYSFTQVLFQVGNSERANKGIEPKFILG